MTPRPLRSAPTRRPRSAPTRRPRLFVAASAIALLACALALIPAQADVLETTDGLVLEGDVTKDETGRYVVEADGERLVLAADRVARVQEGEGPRARLAARAAALDVSDADGWYRLAVEAEAAGLADLARRAHGHVVAAKPDHAASRRALGHEKVDGAWVPSAVAHRRRGLVLFEGAWRLPAEVEEAARIEDPTVAPPSDDARTRAVIRTWATAEEEPLRRAARVALAAAPRDQRLRAALGTLYDREPATRAASARLLGEMGDESALRPLILSGARDLDADVRREAVLAAASFGHDDTAIPFVRALGSQHPALVANAAQALGALGDKRAIAYVVMRMRSRGSSTRNYISFMNQVSYVRDYDVEIAQASNIANPDVATIMDGVILDVKVISASYERTWIEPILVDTASQLAGRSFKSAEDVLAWYAANEKTLPDFPEAPGARKRQGSIIGAR